MADVNSTTIANILASIPTYNNQGGSGAPIRIKSESIRPNAEADGTVYRLFRVKSNDSIKRFMLANDPLSTGSGAWSAGFYEINGGAAVNHNLIMNNITMSVSRVNVTDFTYNLITRNSTNKRIWELLGLSADPVKEYDFCLTAGTYGSTPVAGDIAVQLYYTSAF